MAGVSRPSSCSRPCGTRPGGMRCRDCPQCLPETKAPTRVRRGCPCAHDAVERPEPAHAVATASAAARAATEAQPRRRRRRRRLQPRRPERRRRHRLSLASPETGASGAAAAAPSIGAAALRFARQPRRRPRTAFSWHGSRASAALERLRRIRGAAHRPQHRRRRGAGR